MIPLFFSVFSSTIIFVIFKLFKKFKIDTFQAIVFNYFTAAVLGFSLYSTEWKVASLENLQWIPFALLCALLFIGLFFIIGKSTQANGVASTSIAVKMSMAVSLVLMIFWYSEHVSLLKIIGITLAFIGVFFVSFPNKNLKSKTATTWMLLLLFIGSGALDFTLNFVQKNVLGPMSPSLFTAISLGLAGILGSLILTLKINRGKTRIKFKNLVAGVILGIPNYFAIYLLLLSYRTTGWNASTVLAITNVSVVLCSAIVGFIVFREIKTRKKLIGLFAAISAIIILYFEH